MSGVQVIRCCGINESRGESSDGSKDASLKFKYFYYNTGYRLETPGSMEEEKNLSTWVLGTSFCRKEG